MAVREARRLPAVLGEITAVTNPLPTGTETGLFLPFVGPPTTTPPDSRMRTDGTFAARVARGGGRAPAYSDDFYNRIHLNPRRVDAGNLVERLVYEVELFNAYMTAATLADVAPAGTEGTTLAGLDPPKVVPAMTSVSGTLEITLNGPAVIDGSYTFSFDLGPDLALLMTGTRIITFSIAPDWTEPVVETLSFWTDVLESRDGSEQRIIMRAKPRWRMAYSLLEGRKGRPNLLDSLLAGWGGRSYAVPVWFRRSALTSPVMAGETTLRCRTVDMGLKAGDLCVIWRDAGWSDTLEVATVAADSLTVARPPGKDYGDGFVAPAKLCRLVGDSCRVEALTSGLLAAELEFEADSPETIAAVRTPETHEGLGILPWGHDWTKGRERALVRSMDTYDTGLALPSREDRWGRPVDELAADDLLIGTRAELERFKGFLVDVMGRAKAFWVEVGEDQLNLTRPIEAGTNRIYVSETAYGLLAYGLESRRKLAVVTRAGRTVVDVIEWSETELGDVALILAQSWASDVPAADVGRIGFLVKVRMDRDDFGIAHAADEVARTSLVMRGVVD